jgi:hypothetical protein
VSWRFVLVGLWTCEKLLCTLATPNILLSKLDILNYAQNFLRIFDIHVYICSVWSITSKKYVEILSCFA